MTRQRCYQTYFNVKEALQFKMNLVGLILVTDLDLDWD